MAILNGVAFEAKYNDAGTGVYRTGQGVGSIGEGDHQSLVTDIKDNYPNLNESELVSVAAMSPLGSINLNDQNRKKTFVTNAVISAAFEFRIIGDTYKPPFTLFFEVSGLPPIEFPATGFVMDDIRWDNSSRIWQPENDGIYKLHAWHNGTKWFADIGQSGYV